MTCENCIHFEVCPSKDWVVRPCYFFKDRSRFVELPCKVGDLIFIIKRARGMFVRAAKVNSITITESGKIQVSCYSSCFIGFWGNDAFATEEEAKAALKEREAE